MPRDHLHFETDIDGIAVRSVPLPLQISPGKRMHVGTAATTVDCGNDDDLISNLNFAAPAFIFDLWVGFARNQRLSRAPTACNALR